jgi:hypothetical protein
MDVAILEANQEYGFVKSMLVAFKFSFLAKELIFTIIIKQYKIVNLK